MFIPYKRILVLTLIGGAIFSGIVGARPPGEKTHWQNVKVIPKHIDEDQMERLMYAYTRQLGVTCTYCHPDTKPGIFPVRVDFATDSNPKKIIARDMMRMTDRLNKKYFHYTNDYGFTSLKDAVITCTLCHRGLPKPSNMKLFNIE